ncbi:MAG: beta-galactosidase [Candidatus Brocadiaceae bacterium]|nr:beta-galactosidase [Candidatus Brocadiaceae bacterium]
MDRRFAPVSPKLPRLLHGGGYSPEAWPPEVWDEDMRLMKSAGVNVATIGAFGWAGLQPRPETFEFGPLDSVMDRLAQNGLHAGMVTPTAAHPAWLSHRYPEVLRTDADGRRRRHGGRGSFCPSSAAYRDACATVARALAERYGEHPALLFWQVGSESAGACYCARCAAAFRRWLQDLYGDLDALNRRWYTAFGGHAYTAWSQVEPPFENGRGGPPALRLDFARFANRSLLDCFLNEAAILREVTPGLPVTAGMSGSRLDLDPHAWAPHLDFASGDGRPAEDAGPVQTAFLHDLSYGLKRRPFLLTGQAPSRQNRQPLDALKRPDRLRLDSYQAIAHGADSVIYSRWRCDRGGVGQRHDAVVEHRGHENTRVFGEVATIGAELRKLDDRLPGAAVDARVALVFDWESWWALEEVGGLLRRGQYPEALLRHYRALWRRNVPAAVVGPDADLTAYAVVSAPMLCLVRNGWAERVEAFVHGGGRFVATCLSGRVDETHGAHEGGAPGPLRKVTGVWVEETDALREDRQNRIIMKQHFGPCRGEYGCRHLCDLLHAESATVLATYGREFYAGWPAVTENEFGQGCAYYIGSEPEDDFLLHFYRTLCADAGVLPVLDAPEGVEVRRRVQNDRSFLFVLNHNEDVSFVSLPDGQHVDMLSGAAAQGRVPLRGWDVRVFEETPSDGGGR